jgi:hypothetical protein
LFGSRFFPPVSSNRPRASSGARAFSLPCKHGNFIVPQKKVNRDCYKQRKLFVGVARFLQLADLPAKLPPAQTNARRNGGNS